MNTDRKITFEPDEWLYVRGSPTAIAVRNFFGFPDALVERLACPTDCGCGGKHWRLSTERKMRAPYLSVVGP